MEKYKKELILDCEICLIYSAEMNRNHFLLYHFFCLDPFEAKEIFHKIQQFSIIYSKKFASIVPIFDYFIHQSDSIVIVFPKLENNLKSILNQKLEFPFHKIVQLCDQITLAMKIMHKNNFFIGNLSSENIFINEFGEVMFSGFYLPFCFGSKETQFNSYFNQIPGLTLGKLIFGR
jgi:serine/threonine protein kinase